MLWWRRHETADKILKSNCYKAVEINSSAACSSRVTVLVYGFFKIKGGGKRVKERAKTGGWLMHISKVTKLLSNSELSA